MNIDDLRKGMRILMAKTGPAHAFPQGGGGYVLCSRRQSTCPICREDGVPQYPPDRFETERELVEKYWNERWYFSHRGERVIPENKVDLMQGVVIYVRVDGETIVILRFGDHVDLAITVEVICYQHNLALGLE